MYKKKELQLSYFSICEGKKLDDKIVTYFALKAGSTVFLFFSWDVFLFCFCFALHCSPAVISSVHTQSLWSHI